jgi:membrane fusion protein, multidrug efflux system
MNTLKRIIAPFLAALLAGAGAYAGLRAFAYTMSHESTDDAFIEGNVVIVAPKVAGQVRSVHVKDNQTVKAGDLLVEIDPADFQVRVKQKSAAEEAAKENLNTVKASFDLMQARLETAKATTKQAEAQADADAANATVARLTLDRMRRLFQEKVVSAQDFDNAKATNDANAATWRASQENAAVAVSRLNEAKAQVAAAHAYFEASAAQSRQAAADAQAAQLDLSYARITAPSDGRVTRRSVEPGSYVQVGQALLALVPTNLYVIANFKETQLTHMRAGQPAELEIEAYPGRELRAHVDSIQAGSGARFSLLPPENAVGNYVKVVQRVPVKLLFDQPLEPDEVVGPGMSVYPVVATGRFQPPMMLIVGVPLVLAFLGAWLTRRVLDRAGGVKQAPTPAGP